MILHCKFFSDLLGVKKEKKKLFLGVSVFVAGFFIDSPVFAEGKYYMFMKGLENREAALNC